MYLLVAFILSGLFIADETKKQGSTVVTVGSSLDCDFSSIQAAIDSNPDEIRVSDSGGSDYNENLLIENQNLVMNGAFLDCSAAANGNENGFRSFVDGDGTALPVIRIISDSQRHSVVIKNMSFSGGTGSATLPGGGLITEQADLQLYLENLSFFDNNGISGGAIAIMDGDTDVQAIDLQITNNNAAQGGGIYCTGQNNSFILSDSGNSDMGIFTNNATDGDGGGVLLTQGCEFTSYMGSAVSDTFSDFRGINRNTADGKGGGIAVESGAKLYLKGYQDCINGECIGNNQDAVTIGENVADGVGGGVSAQGMGTVIEAYAFNIHGNSAISGAGISVEQNAQLITDKLVNSCWSDVACNQINNNQASFTGGALYAQSGADLQVSKTFLTRNRADLAVVASVWGNAQLKFDSSVVAFNANLATGGFDDEYLFNVFSGGLLDVRFSTITRNHVVTEMIRNGGTQINLTGSIIYGPGLDIYTSVPSGSLSADCLVLNEGVTVTGSNILVGDPNFIAPVNSNFQLSSNSIAIDMCAPDTSVLTDLDLVARGFDVANIPDADGTYDAGAYEYRSDLIFGNGFELIDLAQHP